MEIANTAVSKRKETKDECYRMDTCSAMVVALASSLPESCFAIVDTVSVSLRFRFQDAVDAAHFVCEDALQNFLPDNSRGDKS